jgi:integrase
MSAPGPLVEILRRLERVELLLRALIKPAPEPEPLNLDDTMIEAFLSWSKAKRNSQRWIIYQRLYLRWWARELEGVNLRSLSVRDHVAPALDRAPGAHGHRIAVLKVLYAWLRKVRFVIEPNQDPTFGRLQVPQAKPAQLRRQRAFDVHTYRRVRRHLPGQWRDHVDVLAGTGWHLSELVRFCRTGQILGNILICPQSKAGTQIRNRVTQRVLEAARRLCARGPFSERHLYRALRRASEMASVRTIKPGEFRHSVATHAVDAGESLEAVSDSLHHRTKQTTLNFYATFATPRRVKALV